MTLQFICNFDFWFPFTSAAAARAWRVTALKIGARMRRLHLSSECWFPPNYRVCACLAAANVSSRTPGQLSLTKLGHLTFKISELMRQMA